MNASTTSALIIATLYCVVGVVLLVAGNWYVEDLGKQLVEERALVDQYEAREKINIQLNRLVTTSEDERVEIQSHFLTEDSTINFLTLLEDVAADFGLTIETTSLDLQESENSLFTELGVRFTIIGLPEATTEFLNLIETLPYHSYVASIEQERRSTEWETAVHLFVTTLVYDREN